MKLFSNYSELVHRAIVWVRYLRRIKYFKYGFFAALVLLLVAGLRVATMPLSVPDVFNVSDKFVHFIVFFGFAFLADVISSREPFWLWKALPLALYGFGIEVLQYFSPDRSFSLLDALADFTGILLYWLLKQVVYFLAQRRTRTV